jgi:hypothetical protein
MVKAALLSTQFLGPKSRGVRTLIETHTQDSERSLSRRLLYALRSSQRIRQCVKETKENLNHLKVQNESETGISYVREP